MIGLFAPDPVAVKELRGVSRRWQTYVGRCIFVAITGYLLYAYWKEVWKPLPGWNGPTMMSLSRSAELGREIFLRCEGVSIVITVIAAVIGASDMIAREVRNGSLGLLLLTGLTPWRVVVGKWKGAVLIAFSLYLCSVPVLAIAVYLGGVGPEDLIRSGLFTMGLASVAAALALRFSAKLKSGGAAVAATIPLMILVALVFVLADYLGNVTAGAATLRHKGGVATSLVALGFCAFFLNRTLRFVRERTGVIPGPEDLARERRALAIDELREKNASKPRRILRTWRSVWEDSPLLWKEFTLRPALRIREDWRTRAYVLLFFVYLVSWIGTGLAGHPAFLYIWGTFFAIVALASGSLLFAPEREGRQWLLLLSTPVTAVDIVRAKLLCGLIFPEAVGLICLYLLTIVSWVGIRSLEAGVVVWAAASLFLLFAYFLAAAASLRARTARNAFLFAAGVVAFLVTVPSLICEMLRAEPWLDGWIQALDPVFVLTSFDLGRRFSGEVPVPVAELFFRFFCLYLPPTLLLPLLMVWRFRRIAARA